MRRVVLLLTILMGIGIAGPHLHAEDSVEIQRGQQLVIWPLGETTADQVFRSVTVACQRQPNQDWLCYIPEHRRTNFTVKNGDVLWISSVLAQTIALSGGTTAPSPAANTCNFTETTARVMASTAYVRTSAGTGTAFYLGNHEWLTAAHVVNAGGRVQLQTPTQRLDATLVGIDGPSDLALLHASGSGIQALTLADFDGLRPGQTLGVVGFPGAAEAFDSRTGVASVASGVLSKIVERDGVTYIQTNAEINGGNSGGPLFTECGEIVGVVSQGFEEYLGRPVEGISYAVTLPTILAQLPALRAGAMDWATQWEEDSPSTPGGEAPQITAMCNMYWDSAAGEWSGYETAEACHLAGLDGVSFSDRTEWWGRGFLEWEDLQFRVGDGSPVEEADFGDYAESSLAPGEHLVRIRERISPNEWTAWGEAYTLRVNIVIGIVVCEADVDTYWACYTDVQENGIRRYQPMWIWRDGILNEDNAWIAIDSADAITYWDFVNTPNNLSRGEHMIRIGEYRSWGWTGWSPPFTFTIH